LFERGAHHALVVALLISARRIEIVDADVGGASDDAWVGCDHATEANGRDLQAGAAQRAMFKFDRRIGLGSRKRLGIEKPHLCAHTCHGKN